MLSSHGRARLISDRAAISLAESMSGRRALSARRAFNHNVASLRGGDRTLSSPVAMDYEPSADERAYAKATKSFGKAYKQLLQALDRLETQRQSRQAIGMANDAISDMKEAGMKLAGLDGGLSTVIVDGKSYDKGQFAAWFDGVEQKVLQLATTIRQEEIPASRRRSSPKKTSPTPARRARSPPSKTTPKGGEWKCVKPYPKGTDDASKRARSCKRMPGVGGAGYPNRQGCVVECYT